MNSFVIPVILDARPAAVPAGGQESLLTLPLGAGCLLDRLIPQLAPLAESRILVLPPGSPTPPYRHRIPAGAYEILRVMDSGSFDSFVHNCEASDHLCLVEPRFWPSEEPDLEEAVRSARAFGGATHMVAVGEAGDGVREHVECDAEGRIRRVCRLYDPTRWPATATGKVFCSIVPARALCGRPFASLTELRQHLTTASVLTQDVPVLSRVHDLTQEAPLLALAERLVCEAAAGPVRQGYSRRAPGLLVAGDCRIHPGAQLIGPLVLQDRVTVEQGARLIGPLAVGAGARIGPRAVVAQAIVAANASVAADSQVCQRIVVGRAGNGRSHPSVAPGLSVPEEIADLRCNSSGLAAPARSRRFGAHRFAKRMLDVGLALVGLVALSPLLLLVALLVKATSRGPVFFIHRREREGGREFGCIKFRTMYADAHRLQRELYSQNEVDGPQFKMEHDPRVTPLGRWLRRTNVDELPQLLNVLAGQMSLVGPRPSPFRENQICVAWRRARLSVPPGITGLWQLCRDRRSDGDFHQWIFYDLAYVRHFSFWLDLKILFHTVLSLGGKRRVRLDRLLRTSDEDYSRAHEAVPGR